MTKKKVHPLHKSVHSTISWAVLGILVAITLSIVYIIISHKASSVSAIPQTTMSFTPTPTIDWNNIQWRKYISPNKEISFDYPDGFQVIPNYTHLGDISFYTVTDMQLNKKSGNTLEPSIVVDSSIGESTIPVYKGFYANIEFDGRPYTKETSTSPIVNGLHISRADTTYQGKNNTVRSLTSTLATSEKEYSLLAYYSNVNENYYNVYQHLINSFIILK